MGMRAMWSVFESDVKVGVSQKRPEERISHSRRESVCVCVVLCDGKGKSLQKMVSRDNYVIWGKSLQKKGSVYTVM